MEFKPLSDDEAAAAEDRRPWPDGWYNAFVLSAIDSRSEKDRDMLRVLLRLEGRKGMRELTDFLHDAVPGRLKKFFIACGLEAQYTTGKVYGSDVPTGVALKVQLITERQRGFRPRNAVSSYAVADAAAPSLRVVASS